MKKIKAVVVDDEVANRRVIISLVAKLNPWIEIVGQAKSISEAHDVISAVKPDLVFLDIKMPDGTGFELLEKYEKINFEVVFVTGFDSYALKAFDFNALDYVLKPINPLKFSKTLSRVHLKIISDGVKGEDLKEIIRSYDYKRSIISRISVHSGNSVVLLNVDDIILIQSEERCLIFKTIKSERFTSSKELSDFAFMLDNYHNMIRVSKSTYVNLNFVTGYSKGEPCILSLSDGSTLEIPRRKKGEILEKLKSHGPSLR